MKLDKIFSSLRYFGLGGKDKCIQVGFGLHHMEESDNSKCIVTNYTTSIGICQIKASGLTIGFDYHLV